MTVLSDPKLSPAGTVHSQTVPGDRHNQDYRQLFTHSPVAGLLVDRDGVILEFNRRAADLLLIDPELRSCPDLPGYVALEYQKDLISHLDKVFASQQQQSLDLRIQIVDGQEIPIRLTSVPVPGDADHCQVTLIEMGSQAQNVKVLSNLAYFDQLTGLPNRLLFNDRLRWAIRDARRRKEKLAVMVIDLDNFKTVNDSLGHDAGDLLLKNISAEMLGCLRDSDTLSRMSGDEFTILMQHVNDSQAADAAAQRLLEAIRKPLEIQEHQVSVSGSVGICLYPDDGVTAEELIHHADLAMYRSKSNGRNRIAFFNEAMRAAVTRQSEFEHQLREAIKKDRLTLYYQPLVDSEQCRIIGVEALLRWNSSREGILTAGRFFKTAETLGLCSQFSDWAIRQACIQMKDWLDRGIFKCQNDFRMSVNLCAEQLASADLPDRIAAILRETRLAPQALALDMAEDDIRFEDPQIAQNLRALRQKGIALHLDDFSQGFASLQKASSIPFDCLKIDQMMTAVFLESPSGEALLDTLLNLSHVLGLRVIAEGVENQQAFTWLRAHECDSMQGFYFCKPLPAIEMEMLLSLKTQT